MAALLDLKRAAAAEATRASLALDLEGKRRTLFRLLSLLYDPQTVQQARRSLADAGTSVYAVEVLDVLLSPDLKACVLPLLEAGPASSLARPGAIAKQPRLARADRLCALLHREHGGVSTWTRACALADLGALAGRVLPDLIANLHHPDPILAEEAAVTIHRLDPAAYARYAGKLPTGARERLDRVASGSDPFLTAFAKAKLLRGRPGFAQLPREVLLRLAAASEERRLAGGETIEEVPGKQQTAPSLIAVLSGRLGAPGGGEAGAGDVFLAFPGAPDQCLEPSRLLAVPGDRLLDIAADHEHLLPPLLSLCARPLAAPPEQTPAGDRRAIVAADGQEADAFYPVPGAA
jgi:hypothetical protein